MYQLKAQGYEVVVDGKGGGWKPLLEVQTHKLFSSICQ